MTSGWWVRVLCLVACLVALGACSDDSPQGGGQVADAGGNNGGADAGDTQDAATDSGEEVGEDAGEDAEAPISCEPNAIIRCVVENSKAIEQCNFRGNDVFQAECAGQAVCREGACVDVACIPGTRRCLDDSSPVVCNEAGSEFEAQATCENGSICTEGVCLDPCRLAEESNSYVGCDYWPVELDNNLLFDEDETSTPESPFAVVIANPSPDPARVTVFTPEGGVHDAIPEVYIPVGLIDPRFMSTTVYTEVLDGGGQRVGDPLEGPLEGVVVPPGGQLQVLFPRRQPPPFETSVTRIAWHVQSDRPVVAYQFNPICCNYSFTNDASILLPRGALTENYVALTYPTWTRSSVDSLPATLTVVAVEDDTAVEVRLRDPRIRPDVGGLLTPDADGVLRVTLQRQEVLNIETSAQTPEVDLTGSFITASRPVAVFGGHACTNIPINMSACDHVEQQLFPSETWGQNYIAAPLKLRGTGQRTREATYWKLLARLDGTEITLDRAFNDLEPLPQSGAGVANCRDKLISNTTLRLDAGESCEFGTRVGFGMNGDQPFLVGAFMSGQESTGNVSFGNQAGDPAFFLLPPQEQFRSNYPFLTPATYALDYATVIAPQGTRITLDGAPVDLTAVDHELITTQGYIRAHIPLDDGPHFIEGSAPFGLIVYAYDDFVSYAFTGGLNLAKLSDR